MGIFSQVTTHFIETFSRFSHQFLIWGQAIFAGLLALNVSWLCLWYAFDKDCFTKSLSSFLKRFMSMMIFYTLMLHPNWLLSLLTTSHFMGKAITHIPLDPSSLISMGIALSNKTLAPILESSLLSLGFSALVILIVYLVINFTFISIALELALTLITTTALISISPFFLSFGALGATSPIARQTLDIILGNCFRMLGIYLVVGAGSTTIQNIINAIPNELVSFDQYIWIVSSCLLFWLLSKNLPSQLARIATIAVQEPQGTDSSALAASVLQGGNQAAKALSLAKGALSLTGAPQLAKVAASSAYNAVMQVAKQKKDGHALPESVVKAVTKTGLDLTKAGFQTVGDHIKQCANKSVGGPGIAQSHAHIQGVARRIYTQAETARRQAFRDQSKLNPSGSTSYFFAGSSPEQNYSYSSEGVNHSARQEKTQTTKPTEKGKGEEQMQNPASKAHQEANPAPGPSEKGKGEEQMQNPASKAHQEANPAPGPSEKNKGEEQMNPAAKAHQGANPVPGPSIDQPASLNEKPTGKEESP